MNRTESEHALKETLERLEASGAALRARADASHVSAVIEAWSRIADPERALGRRARVELPEHTGLSLPMVVWALAATFAELEPQIECAARRMAAPDGAIAAPPRLGALILAGNVFSACVQPITVALLARVPVLVKASSKDDSLPRLFEDALAEVDPELASAYGVVSYPGGSDAHEAAILARASVVSAYGSDHTLSSLRARLAPHATFIGHGHGLGVGWASGAALADDARGVARRFALDVAAYDQRGCMSPHAIVLEEGTIEGERFAGLLSEELDVIERELPRGVLPTDVGASQLQWRGVGAASGSLVEGRVGAVVYDPSAAIRPSPGWRNVLVVESASISGLAERIDGLGAHLKALGVAGDVEQVARALPASVAPRVCAAGEMQRPGLLALADGRPPWEGWQRWTQLG